MQSSRSNYCRYQNFPDAIFAEIFFNISFWHGIHISIYLRATTYSLKKSLPFVP